MKYMAALHRWVSRLNADCRENPAPWILAATAALMLWCLRVIETAR